MTDLAALPAALAAPVPGPDPAGADVTYEPAFERLREAVDRLASVGTAVDYEAAAGGAGGPFVEEGGADHAAVVADALTVLTEQSKDLRAAAYLAVSLAYTDGAAGLAAGLGGVGRMTRAHWADLFPPLRRMRARRAAFEFMTGRLSDAVSAWPPPGTDERESLDEAVAAVGALQAFVSEEMGDDAPALSGLLRTLTERQRRVPAEAAPAEEAPAPPPEGPATQAPAPPAPAEATASEAAAPPPAPAPPAAGGGVVPTNGTAGGGAVDAGADPVRAVLQAAAALREGDAGSAAAVRLVRVVRWDALQAAPPSQDGATRIEAPPARRRDALAALAGSDPLLFAEQAEQALAAPPFHFWLDLQHLADGALAGLGAGHADARAALRAETARLVERLPALLDLSFRDGTPFADAATRAWVAGLSPAPPAHGGGGADEGGAGADDALAEARTRANAGDLAGALDRLAGSAPAGRAGFVRRLRTAELCLGAGRADLALALLRALAADADARGLDAWEPALAADVYAALGQSARQAGEPDEAGGADARLAAVAPARAARLRPA